MGEHVVVAPHNKCRPLDLLMLAALCFGSLQLALAGPEARPLFAPLARFARFRRAELN